MKNHLIFLLPLLLSIGCSDPDRKASSAEPERNTSGAEPERNTSGAEPEWKDSEFERKAKVQSLMKQLAAESSEKRELVFSDLRDVHVRKRDMPHLKKEADQNPDTDITDFLRGLIKSMEKGWRLPSKGWVNDKNDLITPYYEKSKSLGTDIFVGGNTTPQIGSGILMEVYFPKREEHSAEVVDLILTLEPEALSLREGWKDIAFLEMLRNLKELIIKDSKVDNLKPLKGLPDLVVLRLENTNVKDLTPLKDMPNLRLLYLEGAEGIDLSSLKETSMHVFIKSGVGIDLSPLKGTSVNVFIYD